MVENYNCTTNKVVLLHRFELSLVHSFPSIKVTNGAVLLSLFVTM